MKHSLFLLLLFFACSRSTGVDNQSSVNCGKQVSDTVGSVVTSSQADKYLGELEKLISRYEQALKKVKSDGDKDALTECASVSVEVVAVENELLNLADKLSDEQKTKFKKLCEGFNKISGEN